jgi:hypothetical protein
LADLEVNPSSADPFDDAAVFAKLFVPRLEERALRVVSVSIAETLDHVDGRICACQMITEVVAKAFTRLGAARRPARREITGQWN